LKLAIVSLSVYPFGIGGAEMHAYQIARHLSKRHSVLVVCRSSKRTGEYVYQGLSYYLIKVPAYPLLYHLLFFKNAFPILVKYRPNFILIDTVVSTGFIGPFFSFLFKIPYVIVVHGPELGVIEKSIFYRSLLRIELTFSKFVVAVANKIVAHIVKCACIDSRKIHVIPVGFDESEIEQYRLDKTENKSENKIIIFVGRVVKQKDPITLLKAVKILLTKRTDFKLIVVGDGDELPLCRQFCVENGLTKHVSFLGALPRSQLLQEFAKADILVLPSIDEGLPVVIMEALALGVPVVTTGVGGIPEVIKDGFNGVIVPPRSSQALAEAINSLLDDRELRWKLINNGQKIVKKYSWKRISDLFWELIRDKHENLAL
jgi:glycosyltransferase involved in cell wall biosynthesis